MPFVTGNTPTELLNAFSIPSEAKVSSGKLVVPIISKRCR